MTISGWPLSTGAGEPLGSLQVPVAAPVALAWVVITGPPPEAWMFPFACAPPQAPRISGEPANTTLPSAARAGIGVAPRIAVTSTEAPSFVNTEQRTRTRPFRSVAALA